MVSLLRKLLPAGHTRLLYASVVVIAANAGGAWSPIGDVTTTMLWIGGQITSSATILHLILPSIVCMVVPVTLLGIRLKGELEPIPPTKHAHLQSTNTERNIIFLLGLLSLIFVPIFKSVTHLPPYMGILGALGFMWIITEIIHSKKDERDKDKFSVLYALRKIDMPSILFFLGILLAIGVLQHTGVLSSLAGWLDRNIGDINLVVMIIGVLSAIIDNVPLVAAAMGMYDMNQYPVDHYFWQFLAYCAGTGGSMLIIGSAAGVAAMGIEKISFVWYLKYVSWLALVGFLAGAITYILQSSLLTS
jgi:Na+/H+ antiporter NhaD/arsenite permease-like protein